MDVATYHVRTCWLLIIFISVMSILILLSAFTTSQTCEWQVQKKEDSASEFCDSAERDITAFCERKCLGSRKGKLLFGCDFCLNADGCYLLSDHLSNVIYVFSLRHAIVHDLAVLDFHSHSPVTFPARFFSWWRSGFASLCNFTNFFRSKPSAVNTCSRVNSLLNSSFRSTVSRGIDVDQYFLIRLKMKDDVTCCQSYCCPE